MRKSKVKILALVMAVILLLCGVSAFGASGAESGYKYKDVVINKKYSYALAEPNATSPDLYLTYRELYEYYSSENTTDTPDYVLIYLSEDNYGSMYTAHLFGDYVSNNNNWKFPFKFGYGIYLPETDELYDLTEAYAKGIDGIENVFTEAGIGSLVGDMDKDRKITIKDATYIQKVIAELLPEDDYIYGWDDTAPTPAYISDFNRDRQRDIKDVTAIQKYVAGIPE